MEKTGLEWVINNQYFTKVVKYCFLGREKRAYARFTPQKNGLFPIVS